MNTKLDILYLVDGSGSVGATNFEKIKEGLKEMNKKIAIAPDKIRIALMQFGRATQTKIEFNFDEKTSLAAVNQGVDDMKWLDSFKTATGDALRRAREKVRNSKPFQHFFFAIDVFVNFFTSFSNQFFFVQSIMSIGVEFFFRSKVGLKLQSSSPLIPHHSTPKVNF